MHSVSRPGDSLEFDRLRKRHQAYFPILNDPYLLVEYVLEFFGPNGQDHILTSSDQEEAKQLLLALCNRWSDHCKSQNKPAYFSERPSDYASISHADLQLKTRLVLDILEDSDKLPRFFYKAFNPDGPEGLAIKDELTWNKLDDWFLCRMPYPKSLYRNDICQASRQNKGFYHLAYSRGEKVEVVEKTLAPMSSSKAAIISKSADAYSSEVNLKPEPFTNPEVIEPEVVISVPESEEPASQGLSTMEVVGLCAVCVGAGVVGGLAVAALGGMLASPAGRSTMGSLASAGMSAFGRRVFTGPRGGRYVITENGTKSYCVP